MSAVSVNAALSFALTGGVVDVADRARWNARDFVADLGVAGWDVQRISALAQTGAVWPFPVDAELVAAVGFAQFSAALAQAKSELGLTGWDAPIVSHRSRLTADELRLMHDVPPHYA